MEQSNEIKPDKIKKSDQLIKQIDIGNAQIILKISENTFISSHTVSNITNINFFFQTSSHPNRQNLVIDGFFFRKNKSTNKNIYFICSEKNLQNPCNLKIRFDPNYFATVSESFP